MFAHARITSHGRVTIPVEIRRRLGIGAGDTVVFSSRDVDTVTMKILPGQKDNRFERYGGIWREGEGLTIDEVNELMRDFRGHEPQQG